MKSKLFFFGISAAFFSIFNASFGQAPNLGTSSSFAIFTSLGAISNVDSTNIIGDVGTNSGAFTGFPPGIITGNVNIADAVTAQAALDVDAAYNYMVSLACDSAIGIAMGSNQTLPPRVYCLGAASSLTGNLILDGLGDPNALFIFKIGGAFTTAISSNIVLINSAVACNVYWQINGLFSLGDNSLFKGTLIANGAVNLYNGSELEGRGFSRAGAISLDKNNVSMNCVPSTVLPIGLLSFTSVCENQKAELKWTTITETNNDYFSIENSLDGIQWKTEGTVDGMGNSNGLVNYSFIETKSGTITTYYRLKQTDFDKTFKYSPILSQEACKEIPQVLDVYPNPSNGTLNLLINENEIRSLSIYNASGIKIYNSLSYESSIDLTNQEDGIYFLHINNQESNTLVKKFIIKKYFFF